MQAQARQILRILGPNSQLFAPLYQRPYVWNEADQWDPFWSDLQKVTDQILKNKKEINPHFLGAIVLKQKNVPTGKPAARSIIDGQQRLTTLQLLFAAIRDACGNDPNLNRHKQIAESYIFNQHVIDEEDRYKVWPTNIDRVAYRYVLHSNDSEENDEDKGTPDKGSRIVEAYSFFRQKVDTWLAQEPARTGEKLDALLTTLQQHVKMVVIDMDGEDNAQIIFETLNAAHICMLPCRYL